MNETDDRAEDAWSGDDDSAEQTARQLVRQLLVNPERQADAALFEQLSLPADSESDGPWQCALRNLVDRQERLHELEQRFDEVLLQQKLESLRELAYGASHEINNPLANISSRAQTLLRDETDPERRKKLETINAQAFRAFEMIADMMLFAKPPDMHPTQIDFRDVVASAVDELRPIADRQRTELKLRVPAGRAQIFGDESHLATAVKALARNSLEALASNGQIVVAVSVDADRVAMSVNDTGPGIPEAIRQHVFDPFFSGREAGRGLGFGLSKCWRIVSLHGGELRLVSGDPGRTEFAITLPRQLERISADATTSPAARFAACP